MKKLILGVTVAILALFGAPVYADGADVAGGVCSDESGIDPELRAQAGCQEERQLSNVATSLIQTTIGIIGLVAVIVMIYGGVKFVTSNGDASAVNAARNTIIYGAVGLGVAVLAFVIVQFITGLVADAQINPETVETQEDPNQ